MDANAAEARKALGVYTKETVLYGRFEPLHDGLPVVNFAYVPLTPDELREEFKRASMNRAEGIKQSVTLISRRVRQWDLADADGQVADCRNAAFIGASVDPNIVNGIAEYVLDGRRCEEAREALANFPKR